LLLKPVQERRSSKIATVRVIKPKPKSNSSTDGREREREELNNKQDMTITRETNHHLSLSGGEERER